jgi:beta-1,4-N-acetylglucosaminyltransferase
MQLLGVVLLTVTATLVWRIASTWRTPDRKRQKTRRVMVVLGSGGHTSEMVQAIEHLPKGEWAAKTVVYVVAATDKDSRGVAQGFEMAFLGRNANVAEIPRAREVGQSYFTSIFTTLRAFASAFLIVMDHQPDAILTNGPGVCIPIVAANFALSVLFFGRPRATMAYFESFTCVDHLSLSGKIMLLLADVFTVQWPGLAEALKRNPLAAKLTRVSYAGRFVESVRHSPPPREPPLLPGANTMLGEGKARRTCIVTVGSTKFDDLIRAVDTPAFYDAVTDLGINHVMIQIGRSTVKVSEPFPESLMVREVFDYRPGLPAEIRKASLVISHAGAGTILEALNAGVPTIVVPNARLMSNHQLQLAQGLNHRGYLLYAMPDASLIDTLRDEKGWKGLKRFPQPNGAVLKRVLLPILE